MGRANWRTWSGWLWLRSRLKGYRDRGGRTSGAEGARSPFAGLARDRFGLGMAASGTGAASQETLEGRNLYVSHEQDASCGDARVEWVEDSGRHGGRIQ